MKMILIAGGIGKDAELRRTQSGDAVCSFSVAVNDRKKETTEWFDVTVWGKRGEALQPYIKKGGKVTVCGDFQTREHNGKTYLQVSATEVTLQGGQPSSQSQPQQSYADASGGNPQGQQHGFDRPLDDNVPF